MNLETELKIEKEQVAGLRKELEIKNNIIERLTRLINFMLLIIKNKL